MNVLDLFAGAGGSILAGKLLGWRTVCAVEIDAYCRRVLLQRQRDGILEPFPIWDDIRTFDGREWRGRVDVVTAGFPCQPFSTAGKQRGAEDERNLWPDTVRVLDEVRPRFALLENVSALLASGYYGRVLGDLAESGCDARWCVLSAAGCGANHLRRRLWIHANAHSERRAWGAAMGRNGRKRSSQDASTVWHVARGYYPEAEPGISRMANDVANQLDRCSAVGNGWVPIVAAKAWRVLTESSDTLVTPATKEFPA